MLNILLANIKVFISFSGNHTFLFRKQIEIAAMNESDLEKAGTAGLINQDNSAKSVYAQIRDAKRQSDSQSNFCCIVIDIIFSTSAYDFTLLHVTQVFRSLNIIMTNVYLENKLMT